MVHIFSERYTWYIYKCTQQIVDKIYAKCFPLENIFHTTGRYRYLLRMTFLTSKKSCHANHSFVGVRLNAEYLKEGQRHGWIFQSKASEPGMPGWVHPTEVVRATSCSNQLAFLSKQGVKERLCHDLRLGYLASCPIKLKNRSLISLRAVRLIPSFASALK